MDQSTGSSLTSHAIKSIPAPDRLVFRISRLGANPFIPPPWEYVGGNRFDDPNREFRVIYCASERAATFGETLARFRRSMTLLALMTEVDDEEESIEEALGELIDPKDERRGVIPVDWRFKRQIGSTHLDPSLQFAAIAEPESLAHLRVALAPQLTMLALSDASIDFDLGSIFTGDRRVTQHCARYIYDQRDDQGNARFAGIFYASRLNLHWGCWAIFADRLIHTPATVETTIDPHDSGFLEAARLLELSIETGHGQGAYIRP